MGKCNFVAFAQAASLYIRCMSNLLFGFCQYDPHHNGKQINQLRAVRHSGRTSQHYVFQNIWSCVDSWRIQLQKDVRAGQQFFCT